MVGASGPICGMVPNMVPLSWRPMSRGKALLGRATANPAGLRFSELCRLAECFGWKLERYRGSHRLYGRTGQVALMNFQDVGGRAKAYQVRQLVRAIGDLEDDL